MNTDSTDAPWPLPLHGDRILVRALRPDDQAQFQAYRSDPEVARYQGWSHFGADEARTFIAEMKDANGPRQGGWIQLGMALRSNDCLIGDIGLYVSEDGSFARIGYSCCRGQQRQGLTSEAVRLVLQAIAMHTRCQDVLAVVDARNVASERLLIRLGFALTGVQLAVEGDAECVEHSYALAIPAFGSNGRAAKGD